MLFDWGNWNTESYVNQLNFGESVALSPLGAGGHRGSNLSPQVIGSRRAGVAACGSQAGVTTSIPWGSSQYKEVENPERQV